MRYVTPCTTVLVCAALLASGLEAQSRTTPLITDGWFTTSDSVRLHYLVGGSGSTILFVPGWTLPGDIWEPQLRHFAITHRVVALDPRSQGRSDRPVEGSFVERRARDIDEFIAHLAGPPLVLVGWSLGVHEVLQTVEQFGTARIAGIVLVDDFIWTTAASGRSAYFEGMLTHMLRDRRAFTGNFVRGMYKTAQDSQYIARLTQAALSVPTPTAYMLLASAYTLGRRDWRPALDKIDRPLLYVGTSGTQLDADTVRARVAKATVELFPEAGHALFVDASDRFNRVLEAFVRGLP